MPTHSYRLLLRSRSEKMISKKRSELEELTHLTERSFEDTTIIARLAHPLAKKGIDKLIARLRCSSLTSRARSVPEDASSSQIRQTICQCRWYFVFELLVGQIMSHNYFIRHFYNSIDLNYFFL